MHASLGLGTSCTIPAAVSADSKADSCLSSRALLSVSAAFELATASLQVGRASDIWSLGCILYQMVYGRTPFFTLPFIQKMHAITNPNYAIEFPPLANGELVHAIQRCLDRNPKTRATMQVRHGWGLLASGRTAEGWAQGAADE